MSQKLRSPLNPGVTDLANLLRVELLPFLKVEFLIEVPDKFRMDEVYESVANVALILR